MHKELFQTLDAFDAIVFVGGGTGGHISPIISLAQELWATKALYWMWGKVSQEAIEAEKHHIPFFGISVLKLPTTRSPKIALYPLFLMRGYIQAKRQLWIWKRQHQKICLFSKWWPGALAMGLAAKSLGIPIFIHESDTIPGRSNRQLASMAKRIFLGFESSSQFFPQNKSVTVGQILDNKLFSQNTVGSITWKTDKMHILLFCGSQGARSVFEAVLAQCADMDVEWIVVLGRLNTSMRAAFQAFQHIQIFDWLEKEDQRTIFEGTDIAVTRWSATSLEELDIFQIRKIIVPLPSAASNHQYHNAKEYEKNGDTIVEQKNLDSLRQVLDSAIAKL